MGINESNVDNNLGLSAFVRQAIEFLKEYKVSSDRRMDKLEKELKDFNKSLNEIRFDSLKEDKDIELKVTDLFNQFKLEATKIAQDIELEATKKIQEIELKVVEVAKEQKIRTVRWSVTGNVLTLLVAVLTALLLTHFWSGKGP